MTRASGRSNMGAVPALAHPDVTASAPSPASTLSPPAVAVQQADEAAAAARVLVRDVTTLEEMHQVVALYDRIWGRTDTPPITVELMRALTKAGNYVGAAFDGEALVGACVGFFHAPADDALHSHIAGVAPETAGRHVGFALKLHQRAWAMAHGVAEVAWTYDPLVSRNAHFNVNKLGADPVEYLPDFYGAMKDSINAGVASDRLLVRWRLADPDVVLAASGAHVGSDVTAELAAGAVVALDRSADGEPERGEPGATSLVAVPRDVEALRRSDPGLADRWRREVRDVLGGLLADGGRIAGFDRNGWYVVRSGS